jgi:hypothetical protein
MRLKTKLVSFLSSTSAGEADLGNEDPAAYEIDDNMNEGGTRRYRVPNGTEDQDITPDLLASIRWLFVKTDKAITIKLDGTEVVDITPPDDFDYGYLVLTAAGLTSLTVSNSSGSTAVITTQTAGDVD